MPARRHSHHRTLATAVVAVLVATLAFTSLGVTPASAVDYPAPTLTSPSNGTSVTTNPVLTWNRVAGATTYRVQLSTTDAFTTLVEETAATANNNYVPAKVLPAGTIFWRVSVNGGASANWSLPGEFSRAGLNAPQQLTPANGDTVHAPTQPEAYSWAPVAGAIEYNLQVGEDETFTDPLRFKEHTTRRASYVLPTLPARGTKYWRVRAVMSSTVKSDWSAARRVEIALFDQGIPAQPTSPANNASDPIKDVILDWPSIAGAAKYDLEVALDEEFLNVVHSRLGIVGSRYSPPGVLGNDQYWWRIRPVDAANHAADWADMPRWNFQRAWDDQAHLQWPEAGATVSDAGRVFFQWSGVPHATTYRLDISSTPGFEVATTRSCTTTNTTFTPNWGNPSASFCRPVVGTTYWWRVVANDTAATGNAMPQTDPHAVDAEVRTFTFSPTVVPSISPADGASVDVPTLRWQAVSAAERYRVTVVPPLGSPIVNTTYGTSLTLRTTGLALGTYRWQVEALSGSGAQISNPVLPIFQDTFTLIAPMGTASSAADPIGSPMEPTPRPPTLSWNRVVSATKYTLRIKRRENPTWTTQITGLPYPAGEPWDAANLPPGTYDFQVEAFNKDSASLGLGNMGEFVVASPKFITGHHAALVGTDLDSGDTARSCDATLDATCQNLRQTPVLAWNADPDAGVYRLILSPDKVLTDSSDRREWVHGTAWTDIATLLDANASTGTYWAVISCPSQTPDTCVVPGPARHAFNKLAPRVKLTAPAHVSPEAVAPPTHANEVVLSWQDWLGDPEFPTNVETPLTATPPTTEARHYQVQTSTTETFGTLLDNENVDQTTFTSFIHVYPEGPIFWRVRAFDGSNRASAWSEIRRFVVKSQAPTKVTPAANAGFPAGAAFTWQPRELATAYQLKVLKDDGSTIDTATSGSVAIDTTEVQQTSFSPTQLLNPAEPLGTDGNNYVWFLRRKTHFGRLGPWSSGTPFRVLPQSPVQLSPAASAVVEPRGSVFSWQQVDGATSYQFQHRAVGGAHSTVTTVAFGYAPTDSIASGPREWRVVAFNSAGHLLGSSGWRTYSARAITGTVSITGQPRVGGTLTAMVNAQPTDATKAFQWLVAGSPVGGATAATYTVKSSDVGKAISVRVILAKAGYDTVTITSNTVTGAAALAVKNTALPTIAGTPKIGYTLTSSTGSWSPTPSTLSYQWFRNGVVITGATSRYYKVTALDPGRGLQVRVTAKKSGYTDGIVRSAAKAVPKVTSKTVASYVDSTIRTTTSPQMRVTVTAPGIANPTGTVQFFEGTTLLKSVALGTSSLGKVTVTLPRRAAGSHYIHVRYLGSSYTLASTSAKMLLTVSR